MRTTRDHQGQRRVLISSYLEQKTMYRIKKNDGTFADLQIGYVDSSLNGWENKATVGIAISEVDEIRIGDNVLCPYHVFINDAIRVSRSDLKKLGLEPPPGEEVFSVSKDLCWMVINEDHVKCVNDNMICRRIYKPSVKSALTLVHSREKYKTYVYVEQMPEDPSLYEFDGMKMSDIKVGDVIAVKEMSDVEFKYVIDNQRKSFIRVNFRRDFLGFINNNLEYEF